MLQKPPGPKDEYCPFWRKSMSKCCQTCPFWQHLRGMDRNTGAEVDQWSCAVAMLPQLTIENTAQVRGTQAAMESYRNEAVNHSIKLADFVAQGMQQGMRIAAQRAPSTPLLEANDDGPAN